MPEVKERSGVPTMEIIGVTLALANWLNGTSGTDLSTAARNDGSGGTITGSNQWTRQKFSPSIVREQNKMAIHRQTEERTEGRNVV